MSLEIVPDLLGGIEFRGVAGEPLDMQSRVVLPQPGQVGSFVVAPLVPKEDNVSPQVMEQLPHGFHTIAHPELLLDVSPDLFGLRRIRHPDPGDQLGSLDGLQIRLLRLIMNLFRLSIPLVRY